MAMKRCPDCGEKYSDTYKYCPFCEEEEILKKGKTGGRRARQERSFSLLTPVLVILILLMAGLLIFLLRGDKQPTAAKDPITPQPGVVTPVTPDEPDTAEPGTDEPDTEDPGVMPNEPDDTTTTTAPNTGSETGDYEKAMALPDGLTLSTTDFTMKSVGETASIRVSGGSGSYTWISEDDGIASVDSTGKVTAISKGTINIVVTDGSKKGVCIVRCNVSGTAAPATPSTPSTATNTGNTGSSTSGSLKTGSGVVTNAAGGVNVRPSAGTDGSPIASLKNGDKVQIVSSAGNGWYQISFSGPGGADVTGYMKGDYLTNS